MQGLDLRKLSSPLFHISYFCSFIIFYLVFFFWISLLKQDKGKGISTACWSCFEGDFFASIFFPPFFFFLFFFLYYEEHSDEMARCNCLKIWTSAKLPWKSFDFTIVSFSKTDGMWFIHSKWFTQGCRSRRQTQLIS